MKYNIEFDITLRKNPYKGLYIAIEGIDGSGKTTQVEKVARYFEKQGKQVVRTGEPRKKEGVVGKLIQDILLSKVKVPSIAFQYLMSAERAIHHEELIIPSLKEGKVVVSDRCFWSAIPYGILDRMVGNKKSQYDYQMADVILVAQSILSMYHQFTVPDFTFYLEVSLETALNRIGKKTRAKELYEKKDKLEKVILGYKWLVERFPKEITVIDGEKPIGEVTHKIVASIK